MATEAPIKTVDNVFRDEDKTLRYYIRTGMPVVVDQTADAGATTIQVEPLKEAIANSSKVRFGQVVATLTAAADAGDESLTVTAILGSIARGNVGKKVQDITGWTFEYLVKESPGSTANVFTGSCAINDADDGIVDVSIADTDTAAITPKVYHYKLRRTNGGNEQVLAFGEFNLRA